MIFSEGLNLGGEMS
jgi:hypothetical protein